MYCMRKIQDSETNTEAENKEEEEEEEEEDDRETGRETGSVLSVWIGLAVEKYDFGSLSDQSVRCSLNHSRTTHIREPEHF